MKTVRRAAALAVLAATGFAATVAVTGCAAPAPQVIPTALPSTTPVFASDADALAAAKKAFTGYVAASDAIGNDGGQNPERIARWVTPSRARTEVAEFKKFAKSGDHFDGSSTLHAFRLQQLSQSLDGKITVSIYVCDDVSQSHLISANGVDVTPASRQDIVPVEVQFQNSKPLSTQLLVEGSTPWAGKDFCSE